jgi:ketosteroid isomerase-like protein
VSQANVELHRRGVEAFNARDIEALIDTFAPQGEFHSAFASIGGAVYHGHDGLRNWHRDLKDTWGDQIRNEPERYFDLGQHTLLFYVLRGRGRQSGAEVAMPVANVCRWAGGLCVYSKMYLHREDALADLGVTEAELEPIAP